MVTRKHDIFFNMKNPVLLRKQNIATRVNLNIGITVVKFTDVGQEIFRLRTESSFVFSLVSGKRTLQQIKDNYLKAFPKRNNLYFWSIVKNLLKEELIEFNYC